MAYLQELIKSMTLAPMGVAYKTAVKGNRQLAILPECLETKSLFVHIPKTGGHSVGLALYGRDPYHYRYVDYRRFGEANGIDVDALHSFAIVRHPVDRLYSMYNYFRGLNYVHRQMIQLKLAPDFQTFATRLFDARKAMIEGGGAVRPFFYSQLDYVCDASGKLAVDQIIRLEDLSDAFPELAARVGKPQTQLLHVNKSKSRAPITQEDRAVIAESLKDEISMFGY